MAQIDIAQVARRDIKAGSNPDVHKEKKKKYHPVGIDKPGHDRQENKKND
jgi:hypothetical protein